MQVALLDLLAHPPAQPPAQPQAPPTLPINRVKVVRVVPPQARLQVLLVGLLLP